MSHPTLRELARRRWRVAICISVLMAAQFFGYVLLLAFAPETANILLRPGLTVGIVLGTLIVIVACGVTLLYVRWANRLDADIARLGREPS